MGTSAGFFGITYQGSPTASHRSRCPSVTTLTTACARCALTLSRGRQLSRAGSRLPQAVLPQPHRGPTLSGGYVYEFPESERDFILSLFPPDADATIAFSSLMEGLREAQATSSSRRRHSSTAPQPPCGRWAKADPAPAAAVSSMTTSQEVGWELYSRWTRSLWPPVRTEDVRDDPVCRRDGEADVGTLHRRRVLGARCASWSNSVGGVWACEVCKSALRWSVSEHPWRDRQRALTSRAMGGAPIGRGRLVQRAAHEHATTATCRGCDLDPMRGEQHEADWRRPHRRGVLAMAAHVAGWGQIGSSRAGGSWWRARRRCCMSMRLGLVS